jgi:ABC-type phosphate/phosphonate transport system substrate-binding protein
VKGALACGPFCCEPFLQDLARRLGKPVNPRVARDLLAFHASWAPGRRRSARWRSASAMAGAMAVVTARGISSCANTLTQHLLLTETNEAHSSDSPPI